MGVSLGPVCEKIIVDKLVNDGIIKLYIRYVDDTLLLVKRQDIEMIRNKFNKFDKNLKFTVDIFENCTPHFLDLEISPDGLTIV